MPLFKHHDDQVVDPNANVAPQAGGLSQPGATNPSSGYAANAPGVNDPNYNSGVAGGHQHHLGRDAALGAGAVGVAEHEHHKHQNAGLTNDPNYNASTATGGNHHHLGRDAALGAGGVGLAEHEHHKHQNAGHTNDPNFYENSNTGGGHHLGRDAALGAGAVGVASHEHNKHHGHHTAGLGTTGHEGAAIQDPATMGPHGNPLYPSPHAPVADRLTGHTGTGAGGHTGAGLGAGTAAAGADGTLHSSQVTTSSGKSPSTQAMIGKVEHAIGTVIGSQSLKAKGLAKEEEAIAVKAQKQELVEAERLEGHANLARDRAAAHAATGNVHGHAGEAVGNYGAGPTAVGELNQSGGGFQSIGGAGTARPF